jgi:outer membrane protein assembly factor BamB
MARGNAARSGYSPAPKSIGGNLTLQWVRKTDQAPRPAWPRSARVAGDRAQHVVAADGKLFFGSSADCHIYALSAAAGKEIWSFATDAPVRFAPALWKNSAGKWRVFAVSDDGVLYCLDSASGKLLWSRRGGPERRMLLGNGRMISRHPARGGPVVKDNVVYFGAGIWPSEGIWIYALNAADGKTIWCNSDSGAILMPQPHGGAMAKSGITAQGHLAATDEQLFVPTGRAVPAALDLKTGKLQYFHLQRYGQLGGSAVAVAGKYLVNNTQFFDARTGKSAFGGINASVLAATPEGVVYYADYDGDGKVYLLDSARPIVTKEVVRRGRKTKIRAPSAKWSVEAPGGGGSLIVAGGKAVSGGGGKVTVIDIKAKKVVWSTEVQGEALSLAAAGGRLFVSTDKGTIYCFATGAKGGDVTADEQAKPYGANVSMASIAKAILEKTGVREGYCVDLACGDGALSYELARQSKLTIYAVDSDSAAVSAARKKLRSAGLYGTRVTVHLADPKRTGYPNYFADLGVSGRGIASKEITRLLRPGGGVSCIGPVGKMKVTVRKSRTGGGTWTHQYADAGNTLCGTDKLVRGPLELLWFGSPDIRMPNRHGRGHSPISDGNRMFVMGLDSLAALDIHNGRMLWKRKLPGALKPFDQDHLMGTAGTGSNLCMGGGKVYVHTGEECLVLDPATGKELTEFAPPKLPSGKAGRWGYIAISGGTLLGTLVDETHLVPYRYLRSNMAGMFTESSLLFALDAATGKLKWKYAAKNSIRHNTIAAAGGRVYLIDRAKAIEVRKRGQKTKPHAPGVLLALDIATGRTAWKNAEAYGTMLLAAEARDVLLMCYQSTRFRLASEVGGRMTALRASTGKTLWDIRARYASRPLINEGTIYAQPGAWDLLTGKQRTSDSKTAIPWTFQRSYGCGIISAAPNMLLFRSATLGYRDLLSDRPTLNFGGIRPGCWINVIPAGGLVLMPDATTGCKCSYLNTATVALQPVRKK